MLQLTLWYGSATFAIFSQASGFQPGSRPPEGSWTIFGGTASRYFMYTAVLHLLNSSFRWGSLDYSGSYNASRYKKKVENHWPRQISQWLMYNSSRSLLLSIWLCG